MTQTLKSELFSAASCFNLMAEERPDGPAPTITTSYSITSLDTSSVVTSIYIYCSLKTYNQVVL